MLKSSLAKIIFINIYSALSSLLFIYLISCLPFAGWLANTVAIVACGAFPIALAIDLIWRKRRNQDPHLTIINMVSCCNFVWSMLFGAMGILPNPSVIGIAAIGALANLAYTYWFSSIGNPVENYIKVGDYLPDFTLYKADGSEVARDNMLGQLNMLVFYRGKWCPICMAQIEQIHALFKRVQHRDIYLYFISAEPRAKRNAKVAKLEKLSFLYDRRRDLAQKLGIDIAHGVPIWIQIFGYWRYTMVPTILLVNKDGQIIFADFSKNFRVRPAAHDYMQYFDVLSR